MDKNEDDLKHFMGFCLEKRLHKAIITGIPYVGPMFAEFIYGDDLENLVTFFHKESYNNQEVILAAITELMNSKVEVQAPIHVFGSANVEHIFLPEKKLTIGTKCSSDSKEVFGGGGLNYSSRLMAMGVDAVPHLFLGDDRIGRSIQEYILDIARDGCLSDQISKFVSSKNFCVPKATTSHATIIVQGSQRTILSKRTKEPHFYQDHLKENIRFANTLGLSESGGVIIGHLRCDNNKGENDPDIQLTETLVNQYVGKAPIIVNFGSTQLSKGYLYWKDRIADDVIYQFNLEEAKTFFTDSIGDNPSLVDIIHFFSEKNITGVVTLDRFGAVANFRDGENGVLLAWPLLDISQITDPTGAGDAFAAGMMAQLKGIKEISFGDFFSAVKNGRDWAAYACTTYGGSGDCPNKTEINKFLETYDFKGPKGIEFIKKESAIQIINLIDMAYQ